MINYPTGREEFPDWMWENDKKWHDLSGRYTYHIDRTNTEVRISFRDTETGEKTDTEALRCYQIDRKTTTGRLFQFVSLTSRDW